MRTGAVGDTTTHEDRGFAGAVTGVTGALLAKHFLGITGYFPTSLGASGSATAVGLVSDDKVVHGLASPLLIEELDIGGFRIGGVESLC